MPTITLGKGQCFPDIPPQSLTKRVVPSLLMGSLTSLFAHASMGFPGERGLIRLPKVTVTGTLPKRRRDAMPQTSAGSGAVITDDKGGNVPRSAQQDSPQPPPVHALPYKTPGLIHFQDIVGPGCGQCLLQRGQGFQFFLIRAASVFRATPKMRLMPRILGRS